MFFSFDQARLGHTGFQRHTGNACRTVLPPEAFREAVSEITQWPGYAPTPLHRLDGLAAAIGVLGIAYKDEGPRFGLGSFKALGGAYAALKVLRAEISRLRSSTGQSGNVTLEDVRDRRFADAAARITLVSATDGNHGRSLAWGCRRFGAQCRIYIHSEVSDGRATAIRDLGATVVRIDGDYDASVRQLRRDAAANGWLIVSDTSWEGYTQPPRDVMAGYGVMIGEVTDRLERAPTHVFLQGGVGGMAAAVCAGLRQHWGEASPRVVIVEPDRAACLFESARAGEATSVPIRKETVMAGLSCGEPSSLAWSILREEAQDFLTIPDEVVVPAMRLLARPIADDPAIEAGESAVAGVAAAIIAARRPDMCRKLGLGGESTILFFGSEGITDPAIHAELMETHDHA